jgi:hypothetical protein
MSMSIRTRALIGLAALCCGFVPSRGEAQGARGVDPIRVIVSPGLVLAGGTALESGIGGVTQLAVERGRHRGVLRYAVIADVAGFPDGSGDGDLTELALLYGRRAGGSGPGWSISAGPAVVHFQRCPEESVDPFYEPGCNALGLTAMAEAGVGTRVVGLSVQLVGNLNTEAPFAGLGLTLPLGWMP